LSAPLRFRAASALWVAVAVVLVYVVILHPFPHEPPEVPCRTRAGQVWVFSPRSGGIWERTGQLIGTSQQRDSVPASAPADQIDCAPSLIGAEELAKLTNGVFEQIELRPVGEAWHFALRDELNGLYITVYEYEGSEVRIVSSIHKHQGLGGVGLVFFLVLSGGALVLRLRPTARTD
jgi:hypothetical protein